MAPTDRLFVGCVMAECYVGFRLPPYVASSLGGLPCRPARRMCRFGASVRSVFESVPGRYRQDADGKHCHADGVRSNRARSPPPTPGTATGRSPPIPRPAYPRRAAGSQALPAGPRKAARRSSWPRAKPLRSSQHAMAFRSQALLKTNGFASSAQVRPGARLIIPTYNAALAASSGARFASRDTGHAPDGAKLRFVKGPQPTAVRHMGQQSASEKAGGNEGGERGQRPKKAPSSQSRSRAGPKPTPPKRGRLSPRPKFSRSKPAVDSSPTVQSRTRRRQDSLRRNSAGRRTAGSSRAIRRRQRGDQHSAAGRHIREGGRSRDRRLCRQ